jgi:Peptidase family M28
MDSACDAPGADDDASGTTVAIEAARLIAGRPHRATIVFAALAGEEQGLLGGKRLSEWVKTESLTVGGVLNNDIVGATNGSKDFRPRVFSGEEIDAPQRELGLWLDATLGRDAVRLVFRKDRFGRGGDHLPFVEAGLPAVRFTEPLEDYRHQHQTPRVEDGVEYGDLAKFMDYAFLARVATLNAEAALKLANAPAPPSTAIAEGAVKPDTTITFTAVDDPARSGFEILARETTDARWSLLRTVEAAGTVTLEGARIDDRLFAVRSVGRNGERSIAVDAKPQVRRPAAKP